MCDEIYKVYKESGSRYARVINTLTTVEIARYDVFKKDGWNNADKHAKRLNDSVKIQDK